MQEMEYCMDCGTIRIKPDVKMSCRVCSNNNFTTVKFTN